MKVAILGFSPLEQSESLPTYRYFKQKGAEITVYHWDEPEMPVNVRKIKIEVGDKIKGLDEFDLIVRGPAVHPRQIQTTKPVTTLTNIFVQELPSKNIIGVTGTKGKGTTSTTISKILQNAGKKVWFGGNVGRPLLDNIGDIQSTDWVVLEMSAGQLMDFTGSIHIAVCLMITPDHMDWHSDMDEYSQAKSNLFKHQKPDDIAIYFAKNADSKKIADYSPGRKIPYYEAPGAFVRDDGMIVLGETEVISKNEVKLLGEHNLQNICAALTAVFEALGTIDKAKAVLSSFGGLEHRLELVRELGGVKYYDDSFATTPEATIVALKSFAGPKVVILGGSDKGLAFEPLADEVAKGNVRQVIAIGNTAQKITDLLKERGFTDVILGLSKMPEIVAAARKPAQPRDVVLLSTGCASFGLFKDYKDRGNQFKQAVRALS